ncbi:MAG: hypothetical protein AB1742_03735 [bacterium]
MTGETTEALKTYKDCLRLSPRKGRIMKKIEALETASVYNSD